jgi:hypothetical protein
VPPRPGENEPGISCFDSHRHSRERHGTASPAVRRVRQPGKREGKMFSCSGSLCHEWNKACMASFEPHRSCTGPATATLLPKLNLSLSLTHTQVTAIVRIKITSSSKALHCAVNYCSVETQLFFPCHLVLFDRQKLTLIIKKALRFIRALLISS